MNMLCEFLRELVDKKVAEDDKRKKLKVVNSKLLHTYCGNVGYTVVCEGARRRSAQSHHFYQGSVKGIGYDPRTRQLSTGRRLDSPHLAHTRNRFQAIDEQRMNAKGDLPDFVQVDMRTIRRYLKFGLNPFIPPKDKEEAPQLDPNFNSEYLVAP